jgi:hypothetical protein
VPRSPPTLRGTPSGAGLEPAGAGQKSMAATTFAITPGLPETSQTEALAIMLREARHVVFDLIGQGVIALPKDKAVFALLGISHTQLRRAGANPFLT